MIDSIATSGLIATEPKHTVTSDGVALTSFRLASSPRKFNRATKTWEYGPTNWFTVTAFRHLALNLSRSIHKGERVVVLGRLRVREWKKDERTGIAVEITADAVGHDLTWGTAVYERNVTAVAVDAAVVNGAVGFDPDEHALTATPANAWASPDGTQRDEDSARQSGDVPFDGVADGAPELVVQQG